MGAASAPAVVSVLLAVAVCSALAEHTDCERLATFYVVNHGRHTAIVLRGRDLEERLPELAATIGTASLVEFGWGDAAFYRTLEPTASLALRAVLFPTAAVLHVVTIPDNDLRTYFPGSTVVTLVVPASGYARLLDYLVETFARTADGSLIALDPGLYGESRFYRAEGSFHAFNTCNTWVARAVAATGYPIRSTAVVTADGLLNALRRGTNTPCYIAD